MPYAPMAHETDPREKIRADIGDISEFEVFHNHVLVAIYKRPEKTKSGIFLTDTNREEDKYQSKVGLILKWGEAAFVPDGQWFNGVEFAEGDWIVFKPSDGWPVNVNGVDCRMLEDTNIRGRIQQPDMAW